MTCASVEPRARRSLACATLALARAAGARLAGASVAAAAQAGDDRSGRADGRRRRRRRRRGDAGAAAAGVRRSASASSRPRCSPTSASATSASSTRGSSCPTTRRACASSARSSTPGSRGASAPGVEPFITFGHSRVHPKKLPSVGEFRAAFRAFQRAIPTCGLRAVERDQPRQPADVARRRGGRREYYNVVKAECARLHRARRRRARPGRDGALPQAATGATSTASRRSGACTTTPTPTASARAGLRELLARSRRRLADRDRRHRVVRAQLPARRAARRALDRYALELARDNERVQARVPLQLDRRAADRPLRRRPDRPRRHGAAGLRRAARRARERIAPAALSRRPCPRPASSRATSSSSRSSSRPWPTASSSAAHSSTSVRPSRQQLERLAQPGLAGVQALDDLLQARGRGLVGGAACSGSVIARRDRRIHRGVAEAQRARRRRARAAAALVTSSPARSVDERVAALERALRGRARRAPARARCRPRRARARRAPRPRALRSSTSACGAPCARALGLATRRRPRGADLAQALVQPRRRSPATCSPGARDEPRERLRAVQQRRGRPWTLERGAREPPSDARARASPAVHRHGRLGGVRRRRAADSAATSSISVRSVWWPTEAITGTPSSATVRHSVSSQKQKRSASEPPPRATTMTSTSPVAARSCSARGDRAARRGGPAPARTPTRAGPPSRGGAGRRARRRAPCRPRR